jgi:hypothetical protein
VPIADGVIANYEPRIEELRRRTEDARQKVLDHPIYSGLTTMDALRTFMETHVFAVWDFMSLLKRLQQQLTCATVPWRPGRNPRARRLINEIVLNEESDRWGESYLSHFELYLDAMSDAGANTSAVTDFLTILPVVNDPIEALRAADAPLAARVFVGRTWAVLTQQPLHCQAAAFAFGREQLIPEMFERILQSDEADGRLHTFRYYLQRHVEVDGGDHGPMATAMLAELCRDDEQLWDACAAIVTNSLEARAEMWTGIVDRLTHQKRDMAVGRGASILARATSVSAAVRSIKLAQ